MSLPPELQAAIDEELRRHPGPALVRAAASLSSHYADDGSLTIDDPVAHAAYLGMRAPATYAATVATLEMMLAATARDDVDPADGALGERALPSPPPGTLMEHALPEHGLPGQLPRDVPRDIRTVLDLGAGPGMATWAVRSVLPGVTAVTQVDRSDALLALGTRVMASSGRGNGVSIRRERADVAGHADWPGADLVVMAYALAELPERRREHAIAAAWDAARVVLVLVEPGTPAGFERLRAARRLLLASGAHMVAPCPHALACPMAGDDWCHFAVRVPRSRRHRQLKGGTLAYEDEKFACVVVARESLVLTDASTSAKAAADKSAGLREDTSAREQRRPYRPTARVLRHPRIEKGYVRLTLCTPEGSIQSVNVTRSNRDAYRTARKTAWGDTWDAERQPRDDGEVTDASARRPYRSPLPPDDFED